MIVAIYHDSVFVLPVHPVNRIDRLAPESRKQQRSKQQPSSSFATLLHQAMTVTDEDDVHSFDATA